MTDSDADNFIRTRYGISDPIAQTWMTGITGGIVVAVIITAVAYSGGNLSSVPAPIPSALYQTVPVAPASTPVSTELISIWRSLIGPVLSATKHSNAVAVEPKLPANQISGRFARAGVAGWTRSEETKKPPA